MSTSVKRTLSVDEAAKQVAAYLGLDDIKRVSIALASAAAEEVYENSRFSARVRAIYGVLPPSKPRTYGKKSPSAFELDLTPIKHVEGISMDPSMPLDPYLLVEGYGKRQTVQLLEVISLSKLKESAAFVERRNPGTKPKSRASKAALIDYIMEHMEA